MELFSTRAVLDEYARVARQPPDRRSLQLLGEELDRATGGNWVLDACERRFPAATMVVIDSVRTLEQLTGFTTRFKNIHIHVSAPVGVLAARYEERRRTAPDLELESFEAVRANPTEAAIEGMAPRADLVLDTSVITPREMVLRASETVSTLLN